MDWFKVIFVVAIILQEIQIIALRDELTALTDMVVLTLVNKVKNISISIAESDEEEDETSGDE